MIIVLSNLKGGVGKSTSTQNLAICYARIGYNVAIVDADANQSCVGWAKTRDKELPVVVVSALLDGPALVQEIIKINEEFDIVFVDGTPSLNATTSRIISVADLLIIPMKAGKMELEATQLFIERYHEAMENTKRDIPAYILRNEYEPWKNIWKQVDVVLHDSPIPVLNATMGRRSAYVEANGNGLGAYEYKDKKAKEEMRALTEEIDKIIT